MFYIFASEEHDFSPTAVGGSEQPVTGRRCGHLVASPAAPLTQKSSIRDENAHFSNSKFIKLKIGLEAVIFKNRFMLPHQLQTADKHITTVQRVEIIFTDTHYEKEGL